MPPAKNEEPLVEFIKTLFPPSSVEEVSAVMMSPIRDFVRLNLSQLETLMTSIIASRGEIENLPFALSMGLMERMDDPIKVLNIVVRTALYDLRTKGPEAVLKAFQET